MTKVKTAIFPVGGLGTRFLPATKSIPKEMLPVVDKPLIQYAFEEALNCGIEKFIFITGRNKNVIANHFDEAYELQKTLEEKQKNQILSLVKDWIPEPGSISFIRQQKTLGLGHAILCAKKYVNEPFAVLLSDEFFYSGKGQKPALQYLIDEFDGEANVIGLDEVAKNEVSKYGIIEPFAQSSVDIKSGLRIKSLIEKPSPEQAPSNLAIVGRYVLTPEIFGYLEGQEAGANNEIQLTDSINRMNNDASDNNKAKGVILKADRFDCGTKRGFVKANIFVALQDEEMRDDIQKYISTISK